MQRIGQSPNTNYAMQNEFKEGGNEGWRELALLLPIIISETPCSLARFPAKINLGSGGRGGDFCGSLVVWSLLR